MNRKVVVGGAVVVLAGLLIAGWAWASSGRDARPPSKPSTASTQTSSSPSPSEPASPTDLARAQALSSVQSYYATIDKLASSSTLSLNELDSVATGANVTQEKTALLGYRSNGWVEKGKTVVAATRVTGVDLTNGTSQTPPVFPTVHVVACIDVTTVREVDKAGKTVTLRGRPNFFIETLTIINVNYPSSTGWRVSEAPNKGATSCAGV